MNKLSPSWSVIPETIVYLLTIPLISKTQSSTSDFVEQIEATHTLPVFCHTIDRSIRGQAIPQPSRIPELFNDAKWQLKELQTSSCGGAYPHAELCFISVPSLKNKWPTRQFADWGTKHVSFFKKLFWDLYDFLNL